LYTNLAEKSEEKINLEDLGIER